MRSSRHVPMSVTYAVSAVLAVWVPTASTAESGDVVGPVDDKFISKVGELVVSDRETEAKNGQALFDTHRNAILSRLLERLSRTNSQGLAGYETGLLLSPWLRGKEAGGRFIEYTTIYSPRRPVERVSDISEAKAFRKTLQDALSGIIRARIKDFTGTDELEDSVRVLQRSLNEVADDSTIDWAFEQLKEITSPRYAEVYIELVDGYLGSGRIRQQELAQAIKRRIRRESKTCHHDLPSRGGNSPFACNINTQPNGLRPAGA